MQSVAYATTAASLKCTRDQGWDQLPDHDEVIAFMKAHS
jgi:sugar/nucleoside kinase (ribokinase family)